MKKLITVLFIAALFVACDKEKENDTLVGTTWTAGIEQKHNENDKEYTYTRNIEMIFSSDTRGTFVLKSASLPDDITLDALTFDFSYTYNGSSGKGVASFETNNNSAAFTVTGNKLKITTAPVEGIQLSLELTKK